MKIMKSVINLNHGREERRNSKGKPINSKEMIERQFALRGAKR